MPRLSIVIPATGAIEAFESTLVSVLENRPRDREIIVVSNRKYDDPYSLAGEVTFIEADRRASAVDCVNRGIEAASAPAIHLLAADCEVSDGWCDAPLGDLKNPRVAAVSPLVYSALARETLIAIGVRYSTGGRRSFERRPPASVPKQPAAILGPVSLAAFYRRDALELAGGFQRSLGAMADVDMAISLRALGYAALVEPDSVAYAGPRALAASRGFSHGLASERLFWRNAPAAGWLKSLACHPWSAMSEVLSTLPSPAAATEILGRMMAWAQLSVYPRRHAELRQFAERARPVAMPRAVQSLRIDAAHRPATKSDLPQRAKAG